MKKFILLLFIIPLFGVAQTSVYHPFPYANAAWMFRNSDMAGSDSGCTHLEVCYIDYQYGLLGDTLYAGKRYANLYRYVSYADCPCGPGTYQNIIPGYVGGIRNDTANKRVYFSSLNEPEQLLYDFNWVVGDSFPQCNNIIAVVDSVFTGTGYRKRFITSDSVQFIEGIGAVGSYFIGADLLLPHCGLGMSPYNSFTCYKDADNSYIRDPQNCNIITGRPTVYEPGAHISTFPNPVTDKMIVNFDSEQYNTKISLINIWGQEIHTINFTGQELIFYTKEIKSGVYFLQINETKNTIINRKIIIN